MAIINKDVLLSIKVDVTPGCHIKEALQAALNMSRKLDCFIQFHANDHNFIVGPETNIDYEYRRYANS